MQDLQGESSGADLLSNLPSRGYFVDIEVGSTAFRVPRPYVCDHETDPPVNQILRNDPNMPILRKRFVDAQEEPKGKRKLSGAKAPPERKKPRGPQKSSRRQSRTGARTDG